MKTWEVFAVIGGIVAVGWLLFRRSAGLPLVPGASTGLTSTGGPPSSVTSPSGAPSSGGVTTSLWDATQGIFNGYTSGQLTSAQVLAEQEQVIAAARAAGLPIATGPATETRSGRGHF